MKIPQNQLVFHEFVPENSAKFHFFSTTYQKPSPLVLRNKYEWFMISLIYLFLFFASSCHLARQQSLLVSGVSGELKYNLF